MSLPNGRRWPNESRRSPSQLRRCRVVALHEQGRTGTTRDIWRLSASPVVRSGPLGSGPAENEDRLIPRGERSWDAECGDVGCHQCTVEAAARVVEDRRDRSAAGLPGHDGCPHHLHGSKPSVCGGCAIGRWNLHFGDMDSGHQQTIPMVGHCCGRPVSGWHRRQFDAGRTWSYGGGCRLSRHPGCVNARNPGLAMGGESRPHRALAPGNCRSTRRRPS